jgi:hypothetical protein
MSKETSGFMPTEALEPWKFVPWAALAPAQIGEPCTALCHSAAETTIGQRPLHFERIERIIPDKSLGSSEPQALALSARAFAGGFGAAPQRSLAQLGSLGRRSQGIVRGWRYDDATSLSPIFDPVPASSCTNRALVAMNGEPGK